MKCHALIMSLALMAVPPMVLGAPQDETFTVPEQGADNINGEKLSRLVDRNDPKAMNNIGWLWARGDGGVKQNYKEAMQWFKHAARMGYAPAMNNVGLLYANGHGVKQDHEEAFKWWLRAAQRGNAWAMNAVGDAYETGRGAEQNYELALTWYREAAREGDSLAMWNIGNLTREGKGTEKDLSAAKVAFLDSARAGYAPAMIDVGRMYQTGEGAAQDPVEAHAWYSLAAQRLTPEYAEESEQNRQWLQVLEQALTKAQRDASANRVQALAEQYKKATPKSSKDADANQI